VLQQMLDHGMPPDRPAALIFHGTRPTQRTFTGTVKTLCDATAADPVSETALLVVGEVTNLRGHLRWFDERPLFGKRVVVTRSHEQATELVEALENLGAQAIEAPAFRTEPPEDPEAVDRAAAHADDFQWIVFESATAVTRFIGALQRGPRDIRALGHSRICAIGPSTADRLAACGIKPDVIGAELGADSIGDAIVAKESIAGQRVLVVRPDHVRDVVGEDLARRGAEVTDLVAYRTAPVSPESPVVQTLYRMLLDGKIDAVTFTSPSAVQRFVTLLGADQAADLLNPTVVAAIGPVTAAAATELGITPTIVPLTYTVDGLVEALVAHFGVRS
jgi:uroporphyrinogen III methyltransferase/synthase